MRKFYTTLFFVLTISSFSKLKAQLDWPGAGAFIYLNARNATDESFGFVLLDSMMANESIYFTNRNWSNTSSGFCSSMPTDYFIIKFTNTTNNTLLAGSELFIQETGSGPGFTAELYYYLGGTFYVTGAAPAGSVNLITGSINFPKATNTNYSGTQIFAYTSGDNGNTATTFISAIGSNDFSPSAANNGCSTGLLGQLPPSLSFGTSAIQFSGGLNNVMFDCASIVNGDDFFSARNKVFTYTKGGGSTWNINNGNNPWTPCISQGYYGNGLGIFPVKLSGIGLGATIKGSASNLSWKTEFEQNLKSFILERGSNPNDFSFVAEIPAKNISKGAVYQYVDNKTPNGKVFYRLKMVDMDGSYEYSNVALVNNKGVLVLDVFPNPASNKINVQVPAHEKSVSVSVIGADGRVFKSFSLNAEENRKEVSIQELPAGSYFVIYNDGTQRINARFTKQ